MNSLKNDTSSWNTVLKWILRVEKKPKTMVTSVKKWSVNLQYYDFLFALLHIKFVMSIRQETRIHKMPQHWYLRSPFENVLKISVRLVKSQCLYCFLQKKTPPWPGRRSSPPPPPRCQRPSSTLLLTTISSLWRPWAWSLLVLESQLTELNCCD